MKLRLLVFSLILASCAGLLMTGCGGGEDEKTFLTEVKFNVLGYIMGEGDNDSQPKIIFRENAVEIKFNKESTITDEELFRKYPGLFNIR